MEGHRDQHQEGPTLVITATRAQDLQVLGPAALEYICSTDQGLRVQEELQAEQGQQERVEEGRVPVLVEEGQNMEGEHQEGQVTVGFVGGLSQGQSWFSAWEEEGKEVGGVSPAVSQEQGQSNQVQQAGSPQDHMVEGSLEAQDAAEMQDRVQQAQ